MTMRKIIATLDVTIMAGTHAASLVVNQSPSGHYYSSPLQKIAQAWWRYGDPEQNFPRHDEPPPWERPWRQYNRVQPFHPY